MEIKTFFAQNSQGNVIPTPTVHVYLSRTTDYATGLTDAVGNALPNPFTGSTIGEITFAAPNGDYDVRVVSSVRDHTIPVRFVDLNEQLTLAQESATAAARSETASMGSKDAAAQSATEAEASKVAAALSATSATQSAADAATSKTDAEASSVSATQSAADADACKTATALSAASASQNATEAEASKTAANASSASAAQSASDASSSKTAAAADAASASQDAADAAASKASAAASSTLAAQSAADANASKTEAASSATSAAQSATEAATSQTAANASATAASQSATEAEAAALVAEARPFLGEIRLFSFANDKVPAGWHLCDGTLLSIEQYPKLYALVGMTYGGDSTNFAIPDLRSRVPVGYGQGTGLTQYSMGQQAGVENVTLDATQIPAHTHLINVSTIAGGAANPQNNYLAGSNKYASTPVAGATLAVGSVAPNAGGGLSHNNIQPVLALMYCIAIEGISPAFN